MCIFDCAGSHKVVVALLGRGIFSIIPRVNPCEMMCVSTAQARTKWLSRAWGAAFFSVNSRPIKRAGAGWRKVVEALPYIGRGLLILA
jgi:hypothetical protein